MKFLNKIDGADKLITDANHRLVKDTDISKWNNGVIPNIGKFNSQGALITYILANRLASGLYRTGLGDASDCLLALHDWDTHYKATVYTPNQIVYAKVNKIGVVEDFIEIWNEDLSKIANIDNKVDKVSGKGLSDENYTLAEKNKLAGIAYGATKNDTDANLKNRANHTGTQPSSTISDFANAVRNTVLTGLSTATNAVITTTDTVLSALGKLQKQISDNLATLTNHIGNKNNPHNVTKSQVGLGNVDNIQQATKVEFDAHHNNKTMHITSTERTTWNNKQDALGYTPVNKAGDTMTGDLKVNGNIVAGTEYIIGYNGTTESLQRFKFKYNGSTGYLELWRYSNDTGWTLCATFPNRNHGGGGLTIEGKQVAYKSDIPNISIGKSKPTDGSLIWYEEI